MKRVHALLCWVGFHFWDYSGTRTGRICTKCPRVELLRYSDFGSEWEEA